MLGRALPSAGRQASRALLRAEGRRGRRRLGQRVSLSASSAAASKWDYDVLIVSVCASPSCPTPYSPPSPKPKEYNNQPTNPLDPAPPS
jgi:hypothetical protein